MTVLDSRTVADAAEAAAVDARDPLVRLGHLLDEGSIRPITPEDKSGVRAVTGRVEGVPVVAFCSDARVQGGAMGSEGCEHIVHAYDVAVRERVPSSACGTPAAPGSPRARSRCTRSAGCSPP